MRVTRQDLRQAHRQVVRAPAAAATAAGRRGRRRPRPAAAGARSPPTAGRGGDGGRWRPARAPTRRQTTAARVIAPSSRTRGSGCGWGTCQRCCTQASPSEADPAAQAITAPRTGRRRGEGRAAETSGPGWGSWDSGSAIDRLAEGSGAASLRLIGQHPDHDLGRPEVRPAPRDPVDARLPEVVAEGVAEPEVPPRTSAAHPWRHRSCSVAQRPRR